MKDQKDVENPMKNTYVTSYFPLVSILLFSLSFAMLVEVHLFKFLNATGIYIGMLEFFSRSGIKLALLILLLVVFFMVFAALKLIADTINELSLLFFSKDFNGESLKAVRSGAIIYLSGSILSFLGSAHVTILASVFAITTISYFVFFVYKVSSKLSLSGTIGLIFFQVLTWSTLVLGVLFIALKVYNSIVASLPV
jgi:hypothetical protein